MDVDEATAWRKRSAQFGKLCTYDDGRLVPAFELLQSCASSSLSRAWSEIGRVSPILDALGVDGGSTILRYAAIDWTQPRAIVIGKNAKPTDATLRTALMWLLELSEVYRVIAERPAEDYRYFLNPTVVIDIDTHLRVVFAGTASKDPPPELKRDGRCDEPAFVYVIGKVFDSLASWDRSSPLDSIVHKCIARRPSQRFCSIAELVAAVERIGVNATELCARADEQAWRHFEEGLGWLKLGDFAQSREHFSEAAKSSAYFELACRGLEKAHVALTRESRPSHVVHQSLAETLVDVRTPRIATVRLGPSTREEPRSRSEQELLALATTALSTGDTGYAADLVNTILRKDPRHREARMLLARVYVSRNAYGDALALIDPLLLEADTASAHYLRGKTLFGLGRLHDSREAFDRAFALDPKLLEAMLLRREVDRHIRMHRDVVGEHRDAEIDIPVSLVGLRAVLVSGDIAQAIAALSAHPYREQPDAQLVLARLVAFAGAPQRAIIIYDEAAASEPHRYAALLGKATLLLDFPRSEESALAIFDELCAENPTDADASEGRARALEKLGRIGEAAAEFRRFISLATGRSDLRVRVAADWLRDHPL